MNSPINFFSEDIKFSVKNKNEIRDWVNGAAENERLMAGDINFIFCSDSYLHKLNKSYLKHDTLTDIITFPLMDDESVISGDIFISVERVRENARLYKQKISNELERVIIHGVLHLLGFKDRTKLEKLQMRAKEDYYLEQLRKLRAVLK